MEVKAANKQIGQVVEGFINVKQLNRLAEQHNVDMPIVAAVYKVLYANLKPIDAAKELLSRNSGDKWE